tara:strand:+ start:2735 stop:2926 length:192 start_codon:yes stop_codon:yes gene_type:complete
MTESQDQLNKSFDNNITQITAIIEEQTKSLQNVIDVAHALIERVKKLEVTIAINEAINTKANE